MVVDALTSLPLSWISIFCPEAEIVKGLHHTVSPTASWRRKQVEPCNQCGSFSIEHSLQAQVWHALDGEKDGAKFISLGTHVGSQLNFYQQLQTTGHHAILVQ